MANDQPQPLSDQCRTRLTLDLDLVAGADQYASLATLAQVRERTAQPDAGVGLDRLQPADPIEAVVERVVHVHRPHRDLVRETGQHGQGPEAEGDRAAVWRLARGPFRIHVQRRSEEHTSELQSLMRISYAVFCLNK